MITVAALLSAVMHVAIAVFQALLAGGKPWGEYAWGGQHRGVLPPGFRIGSVFSLLVLLFFAWCNLAAVSLLPLPWAQFPLATLQKIIAGYAALGVLMNGISRSRKERLLWTPVCAVLFVLNAILAGSTGS